MPYFRGIDHTNTTDNEESVVKVTSTEAEKKRIIAVRITKETNKAKMKIYIDRENFFEGNTYHTTTLATIEDFLEFPIDRVLAIGESFEVTLQNYAAGVHGQLNGDIVYEVE